MVETEASVTEDRRASPRKWDLVIGGRLKGADFCDRALGLTRLS